jgi:hypothetical protein
MNPQPEEEETDFTIVILPDTQFYCDTRLKLSHQWGKGDLSHYFHQQTQWVADNKEKLNIVFLLHEGDIVQTDYPEEWEIAQKAMSILDDNVPYCMCLGDHDMGFKYSNNNKYGGEKAVNRKTHFNNYFPLEKFSCRQEFGGTFSQTQHDNSWYHFEESDMKFLVLCIEVNPRDTVLDWANTVVSDHDEYRVIVLTHSYLQSDGCRTTESMNVKGNNGEQMWDKFVKKHKNIFMVLCGHHYGEAVLSSVGVHGNNVFQILADYQHLNDGGESWLRYMVFKPKQNKIETFSYCPAKKSHKNGPNSQFELSYSMTKLPEELSDS